MYSVNFILSYAAKIVYFNYF